MAKASGVPNTEKVGTVTRAQLEEIAELKMPDLNTTRLDSAVKMLAGTARSMGIEVQGLGVTARSVLAAALRSTRLGA